MNRAPIEPNKMSSAPAPSSSLDANAPRIIGTRVTFPLHSYDQAQLASLACELLPRMEVSDEVLRRFFRRVGVEHRYLALPAEAYRQLHGFEARNRAWLEVALALGSQCLRELLEEAQVSAKDVAQLATTTVTGITVPSLDARLMNRVPFAPDLKRVPLFGLGCAGGAAGVARTADYLRAYPEQLAILLSVELCSLTLQADDASVANIISTGLFGDGAAAVLMASADHPLARKSKPGNPRVLDTRSVFFPDTERAMGWDIVDSGFKVVLSPSVPSLIQERLPSALDSFLADHGLRRDDIHTWISHPGGPKILAAIEEELGLPKEALAPTREALASVGNLSSASVLHLLDQYRRTQPPRDTYGLMLAMGPAFCAELVLLRW